MLTVSDPQRLTMPENFVHGYVHYLRRHGVDPHAFATAYVERTERLGYAPDLTIAVREFIDRRRHEALLA